MKFNLSEIRWRYLVSPRIQLQVFVFLWIPSMIIYIVTCLLLFNAFLPFEAHIVSESPSVENPIFDYLLHFKTYALGALLVGGFFGTLTLFFTSMFLTHKLIGPVLKLNSLIKENRDKVANLVFRKDDFLAQEMEEIKKHIHFH